MYKTLNDVTLDVAPKCIWMYRFTKEYFFSDDLMYKCVNLGGFLHLACCCMKCWGFPRNVCVSCFRFTETFRSKTCNL